MTPKVDFNGAFISRAQPVSSLILKKSAEQGCGHEGIEPAFVPLPGQIPAKDLVLPDFGIEPAVNLGFVTGKDFSVDAFGRQGFSRKMGCNTARHHSAADAFAGGRANEGRCIAKQ